MVWTVRTNWGNGIVMNDAVCDRHSLQHASTQDFAVAIFTERPVQQGRGKRSEGTLISTVARLKRQCLPVHLLPTFVLCSCRSVRHALSLPGSTLISSWPLYLWTVWTERKMLQIFKDSPISNSKMLAAVVRAHVPLPKKPTATLGFPVRLGNTIC